MKLQYSIAQYFAPNDSHTTDFTLEPNVPYLIIISATYASTAYYICMASTIAGHALQMPLVENNLNVTLLTDGRLTIQYTYGGGGQDLYINAIRLA